MFTFDSLKIYAIIYLKKIFLGYFNILYTCVQASWVDNL